LILFISVSSFRFIYLIPGFGDRFQGDAVGYQQNRLAARTEFLALCRKSLCCFSLRSPVALAWGANY